MPAETVQRRVGAAGPIDPNLEYHLKNEDTPLHHKLNNLDAVARLIMAMAHTATAKSPEEENLEADQKTRRTVQVNIGSGIKTVAVTRSGTSLLVAQNGIFRDAKPRSARGALETTLTTHVKNQLGDKGPIQSVQFVNADSDDFGMHAEMVLLQHCMSRRLPMTGGTIGVSKPCCKNCAAALNDAKVDYTLWIDGEVPKWTSPAGDRGLLQIEGDPQNFAWRNLSLAAAAEERAAPAKL